MGAFNDYIWLLPSTIDIVSPGFRISLREPRAASSSLSQPQLHPRERFTKRMVHSETILRTENYLDYLSIRLLCDTKQTMRFVNVGVTEVSA